MMKSRFSESQIVSIVKAYHGVTRVDLLIRIMSASDSNIA